jgi:hypothetical protein
MPGKAVKMVLKRRPLLRDVGFYGISLLMLVVVFADGKIVLTEALMLIITYVVYILVVFFAVSRRLDRFSRGLFLFSLLIFPRNRKITLTRLRYAIIR